MREGRRTVAVSLRALITGISGFAGSHLAEQLVAETDFGVWGVSRGSHDHLSYLGDRATFVRGDLTERAFVDEVLEKAQPDLIFHLAAQADVVRSWEDPWGTFTTNVLAELTLLRALVDRDLDCRVLVVGSAEEYGDVPEADQPISEGTSLRPRTPYAVSKVAQDLLGYQFFASHGLAVVRVRPFNHLGPRQGEGFVAADFAKQIAEVEAGRRSPVVRVGNLSARRDFTDVRDIVRAYRLLLQKGLPGEAYNLGSGVARSIRELLHGILGHSSQEVAIEADPARARPSDVPLSVCDASKLREATDWWPRISFEDTLGDVLQDWRLRIPEKERA